ncbi:hypothetical protein FD755_010348 [Muntiacus reevesi]|uniref:Uncharacterized protein n=2 Tax=Muntiacus TaxID=9885 RepID=A0A5N3XY26_MUNRE|nr:hypothetical protein FD754_006129 [Muntiacus muntjak]KAB0378770.1 hypothetical protein FD755_010348 [Muntiacus reevesi]
MHSEIEGKLTLRLIPTSKGPYTGLVYREDRREEDNIRGRQLAQDAEPDSYDHLKCFLDFLDLCI